MLTAQNVDIFRFFAVDSIRLTFLLTYAILIYKRVLHKPIG